MKEFIKTIPGKFILFVLCVFGAALLGLSAVTAAFMVEFDYYTQDKNAVYEHVIDGRIYNDIYGDIWTVANEYEGKTLTLAEHDGFTFKILDANQKVVAETDGAKLEKAWNHTYTFFVEKDKKGEAVDVYLWGAPSDMEVEQYTVNLNIAEVPGQNTFYSFSKALVDRTYGLKYMIYPVGIAALILLAMAFVGLMSVAGRRPADEGLYPGPLNKVPFDVMVVGFFLALVLFALMLDSGASDMVIVIAVAIGAIAFFALFLGLCMSMAVKIKNKNLVKGSLTYLILKYLIKALKFIGSCLLKFGRELLHLIRSMPLIWKTGLLILGICLYELLFFIAPDTGIVFWLIEKIILIPAILYLSLSLRTLQKGGSALASGDLGYSVNTKRMFWDFKRHGENLNDIGKGMAIAVNDQLKSERMKTELITNVSHDIKTPLTSIINYSSLIYEEKTDNEKVQEYSEVLMRQSERLRRLIDDLVEASKASTGNLDVSLMPCDSATFVTQATGEYEDKLKEAELTLVTAIPDDELRIMADSRRMWRIFDNLMNNISKYAQRGTRVYLSLERIGGNAVFTFKNTSREQLNITEEELMERFTRGDHSRNTEGNGLGLSIAKSMAELQNGTLKVEIDGDLFKAILSFPLI